MEVAGIYRILPEVLLTVTGVLIMLIEPVMPRGASRKPIGAMAVAGVIAALVASVWQLGLPPGTAYFGVVQTDAFSVFFHVLITGIVLVSLLVSLDVADPNSEDAGEYYALIAFGAAGMCLMTSAVELLLVFISLEISSISTYILAGFRKNSGKSLEAALKYFLLGSFATAFFLYGIALTFGATGTTNIAEIAARLPAKLHAGLRLCRDGDDPHRPRLQGLRVAFPCLDARCLRGRALSRRRVDVHRPESRRLRRAAAHRLRRLSRAARSLVACSSGSWPPCP